MELIISNDHYLVSLETNNQERGLFLIDTGLPRSFSLCREIESVIVNDDVRHLDDNYTIRGNTNLLLGKIVDGIIGMDILTNYGLTLDFFRKEISYSVKKTFVCFSK